MNVERQAEHERPDRREHAGAGRERVAPSVNAAQTTTKAYSDAPNEFAKGELAPIVSSMTAPYSIDTNST